MPSYENESTFKSLDVVEDTIFRGVSFLCSHLPQDTDLLSEERVKLYVSWGQCDRAGEE